VETLSTADLYHLINSTFRSFFDSSCYFVPVPLLSHTPLLVPPYIAALIFGTSAATDTEEFALLAVLWRFFL